MAVDDSCSAPAGQELFVEGSPDEKLPVTGPLSDALDALDALAHLARYAGVDRIADEATTLAERIGDGRCYVACVGQFKRGKSTLINGLLDTAVLPTGVLPVTSVPTIVRHGPLRARICLARQEWVDIAPEDLAAHVTEEGNPGNRQGVLSVEVFLPSPLLASGLCLVDTPGLGSVFEANRAATRKFIPHIDAAIVVLGADPPISGEELEVSLEVNRHTERLLFVLNKSDRVSHEDRAEAVRFTRRILEQRLGRPVTEVFEVSALRAGRGEADENWSRLVRSVEALAASTLPAILERTANRGLGRLGNQLASVLEERRIALLRPLEDSEQRVESIAAVAASAERSLQDLEPLFTAEQRRLSHFFESRRQAFLAETTPAALAALNQQLSGLGPSPARRRRLQALELAHAEARRRLEPWLDTSERVVESAYQDAVERFVDWGKELLVYLMDATGRAPQQLEWTNGMQGSLRSGRRFQFHDMLHLSVLASPRRWLADQLLPSRLSRRRIDEDARRYLEVLLEVNASRVQGDLAERVFQSRQELEREVRAIFREAAQTATESLLMARAARTRGDSVVREEQSRIAELQRRLRTVVESTGEGLTVSGPDSGSAPASD